MDIGKILLIAYFSAALLIAVIAFIPCLNLLTKRTEVDGEKTFIYIYFSCLAVISLVLIALIAVVSLRINDVIKNDINKNVITGIVVVLFLLSCVAVAVSCIYYYRSVKKDALDTTQRKKNRFSFPQMWMIILSSTLMSVFILYYFLKVLF